MHRGEGCQLLRSVGAGESRIFDIFRKFLIFFTFNNVKQFKFVIRFTSSERIPFVLTGSWPTMLDYNRSSMLRWMRTRMAHSESGLSNSFGPDFIYAFR